MLIDVLSLDVLSQKSASLTTHQIIHRHLSHILKQVLFLKSSTIHIPFILLIYHTIRHMSCLYFYSFMRFYFQHPKYSIIVSLQVWLPARVTFKNYLSNNHIIVFTEIKSPSFQCPPFCVASVIHILCLETSCAFYCLKFTCASAAK
ncbi:hypothetical protein O6H91_18G027100 [Diphasiastrum complanatum]|uniref:Uncharacterized protein n=1 Tax=Diphasiastrum complanatum TaxID=34168 RepID=A0ACC2AZ57_DIPCM|nr:hypothetical protein O6H91_18G027100 [Diphasiastrum complanatum]